MAIMPSRKEEIRDIAKLLLRRMTGPARTLPDFVIIGGQRCGTTSLYNYLLEHPCVTGSFAKEVHYFDDNYSKGETWYRAHFVTNLKAEKVREAEGCFMTGEATPYYLFHPLAPERFADLLPKCKIIVLLRNPVDRAYSHFSMEVRKGRESLTFEKALASEEQRLKSEVENIMSGKTLTSYNHRRFTYKARGLYAEQLERWAERFPLETILIIKSEDFYEDPQAIYRQVLDHLGLPERDLREYKKFNPESYTGMDKGTRKELGQFFEPHNKRLNKLLGRDMGWDL